MTDRETVDPTTGTGVAIDGDLTPHDLAHAPGTDAAMMTEDVIGREVATGPKIETEDPEGRDHDHVTGVTTKDREIDLLTSVEIGEAEARIAVESTQCRRRRNLQLDYTGGLVHDIPTTEPTKTHPTL